jgi:rare lipoprotein A
MKFFRKLLLAFSVFIISFNFSCAPTPEPKLKIGEAYAVNGVKYTPKIDSDYKQIGYASWYGKKFHNKRTANGDIYLTHGYTAAHKTLPMPSVVRVTNLANGKIITVIINDRGPFVKGRIIDVSESAAKALGFKLKGVTKVKVELDREASIKILDDPELKVSPETKQKIILSYKNADKLKEKTANESLKNAKTNQIANNKITNKNIKNTKSSEKPKGKYGIQVLTTTSEKEANKIKSKLQNLSGKIYKSNVNGKIKYLVRIDGTLTLQEAKNLLVTTKNKGYTDAFIYKKKK